MKGLTDAQRARFKELLTPAWRHFKDTARPATTQKADMDFYREHIWPQALAALERAREEALEEVLKVKG